MIPVRSPAVPARSTAPLLAVWLLLGTAAAQVDPSQFPRGFPLLPGQQGQQGQGQQGQQPGGQGGEIRPPSLQDLPGQDPLDMAGLRSTWMRSGSFQGFPVFPPRLEGYGMYPPPEGFMQPPKYSETGELPPPLLPAAPDWPAWIKSKRAADLPYDVGTAVLVRQADRVWLRTPGEDAFIPLYHYDTTRALVVGCDVRVPQTGDFQLLFYGGARLVSLGAAEMSMLELAENGARVDVRAFTRVELHVFERGITLRLPDGSELIVDSLPADAPPAALVGNAYVLVDRAYEPGRYRGRATIWNGGDRPVRWRTQFGEQKLLPGFRVTLFLQPPPQPLPAALTEDAVTRSAEGKTRRWTASGKGGVAWSGARFDLADGEALRIDPLLGDPFGQPPPPPVQPPDKTPPPTEKPPTERGGKQQ